MSSSCFFSLPRLTLYFTTVIIFSSFALNVIFCTSYIQIRFFIPFIWNYIILSCIKYPLESHEMNFIFAHSPVTGHRKKKLKKKKKRNITSLEFCMEVPNGSLEKVVWVIGADFWPGRFGATFYVQKRCFWLFFDI